MEYKKIDEQINKILLKYFESNSMLENYNESIKRLNEYIKKNGKKPTRDEWNKYAEKNGLLTFEFIRYMENKIEKNNK